MNEHPGALEYRQLTEDLLDDLASVADDKRLPAYWQRHLRKFVAHWTGRVGDL